MKPILRYAACLLRRREETAAYRVYMTDCVRLLTENVAKAAAGAYIRERYWDILHPKPADNRTEEERFYDCIHSLGFEVVDG